MRLTDEETPPAVAHARTLVVPTVSAANVPQLALDLLLHTHGVVRVGSVVDPAVLPAAGADALGNGAQALSTSCELFCDAEGGVAVLQLRAPLAPGTGPAFARRVHEWARRALGDGRGGSVVWLHSSHAEEVGGGGPMQQHVGPTGADVEYALAGTEASSRLASALGQTSWAAIPPDDPRREDGHPVRGLLDAAADGAGAAHTAVLSSTVAEWSALQDAAALATALSALLAALAAADGRGAGAGPSCATATSDWKQPPAWAGLLL